MKSIVMYPDGTLNDVAIVVNVPDIDDVSVINDILEEKLEIIYHSKEFKCFDCPSDFPVFELFEKLRKEVIDNA